MDLILAIILIYGGGPLGLLLVLIGGIGLYRNTDPEKGGWSRLFLVIGILLVIFASWMFYELMDTNFGL